MPIGTKTKAEHSHGEVPKNIHHVKLSKMQVKT